MRYNERTPSEKRAEVKERLAALEVISLIKETEELLRKAGFDPNQPRVPSGNPNGGQWTSESGSSGGGGNAPTIGEDSNPKTYRDIDGSEKPVPKSWARPERFQDHYDKHGKDFGSTSGENYADKAQAFRIKAIREKLPTIINKDGYRKIYDSKTRIFGVYHPNGKTETFFKPRSENYFESETEKVLSESGRFINEPITGGGAAGFIKLPGIDEEDFLPPERPLE